MHLRKIAEFVNYLSLGEHELEDILSHLVYRVMTDLSVTSIFVSRLTPSNSVEIVGQWGIDPNLVRDFPKGVSLFENYPITDALRSRKTIWINTLPDWGKDYPLLESLPYKGKEKTFICMALEQSATPVAVIGFFAAPVVEVDSEVDAFVGTIANLLSLYLMRLPSSKHQVIVSKQKSSESGRIKKQEELTERQVIILRLIAENRTNRHISDLLGYSESTIRQETIKIYAKLDCNGRKEASDIYHKTLQSQEVDSSEAIRADVPDAVDQK
jgi:DNA-binding NarL/FixJ family response regulator